jgi:hypothetical protein
MSLLKFEKIQVNDPLPVIDGERMFELAIRTDIPGERLYVRVNASSRVNAIRRVLRRAAFQDGRIDVVSLDVTEVNE